MKQRLSLIRRTWRRLFITLVIVTFSLWNRLPHPRYRAHWLGRRRRRPERLFTVLLFLVAMIVLDSREYATWAMISGSFAAVIVPVLSVYQLIPRKRAH